MNFELTILNMAMVDKMQKRTSLGWFFFLSLMSLFNDD